MGDPGGERGLALLGFDPTGEVNRLRHEVSRLEKRVADGEEFLTDIFFWLEDQRDPGQTWENQHYIFQTSLRLYLTHEKGVPGRGRNVRIVTSILGPEPSCNNLCQFHKGFEGIGYVAEIAEAWVMFSVGAIAPELVFAEAAFGMRLLSVADEILEVRAAAAVGHARAGGRIRWVDEAASMSDEARAFDDGAHGARSNVETQKRQVPQIEMTLADGTKKPVRFDGYDGAQLIDRKRSVVTTKKAKDQAARQSQALRENGLTARWEVPTEAQARRARKVFEELGIKNITVRVVDGP